MAVDKERLEALLRERFAPVPPTPPGPREGPTREWMMTQGLDESEWPTPCPPCQSGEHATVEEGVCQCCGATVPEPTEVQP